GQGRGAYIDVSNNGMIEINEIIVNDCKGINGGGIQINCQCSQKQTIQRIQLTDCVADQNGGGLYCIISSGEIELDETTIIRCSGLNGGVTTKVGGAICAQIIKNASSSDMVELYFDLQSGTETKFDLTGASYSTTASTLNSAQYGKNLFIKAANLRIALSIEDATRFKIGAKDPETDFYNLIGYDGDNTLAIPLYYVCTAVGESVYNVKYTSGIDQGNDNIGCGHFDYPCLTIYYAIQQNESASAKKVMIINEYQLNSIVNVNLEGKLSQRYIDAVICSSISDNSIIQIKPQ
ncbi:MAG: hypothetical protein EZS28_046072, partial [Streblomastix strix]